MKTKNILMVSLMAVAVLTSCSGKLGQLSGDYFKVNPNPLVADGGQVDATINGVFPEKYMKLDIFYNNDELEQPFDFREFFHSFHYSDEAKALYDAALKIFLYYHNSKEYSNKDYNDSFYDITNAIMGKDINQFLKLDSANDRRITKVKTTKGTRGFGRNTIKYVVSSKHLPIFEAFFNARDILAKKINKQLLEQKLLLWERENIY